MSEKNLPIKLVLQKASDVQSNPGRGSIKYFCEVTPQLQKAISEKFEGMLLFYEDVFQENELIPAVGKITVKPEAIAKSHKPNDLCRHCPIIGSEDLNEIYIKLTKQTIRKTISLINRPPSEKFRANLTAIQDIQPITGSEKISTSLVQMSQQKQFELVKGKIKVKLFDFDDEFDNTQIMAYVLKKLASLGLADRHETIAYGNQIKYIKIQANSYEDVENIARINGVKSVDFFQEYSLPLTDYINTDLQLLLEENSPKSEISIGIIDGGISSKNKMLKPYIQAREEYVPSAYINESHATFIASTIQYGNRLNNILHDNSPRFTFVDIVAIPNGDTKRGPTDTISEESLMEIIEEVMEKYASSTKIWNMSLGIESKICNGSMSDLGIFLDYIQDKYKVQIFVSSGNLNHPPLREWPAQSNIGERDRIISPADSVRAITVGSIHSARMNSRELLDQNQDNIKYYGFGMPAVNASDILQCSEDEVTLVFRQKVSSGTHLEMFDFPYPKSLIKSGKWFGEIGMTLAYNPVLDERYGREYCRINIDASFGIYKPEANGKMKYAGQVPLECTWDERFEQSRVENGFKWSPIKSYYRKISNRGINVGDGWKIRIDMTPRSGLTVPQQEFVLILTIRDPLGHDIYSEVINGLRERGYITNNLETRQQLRYRG